MSDISIVLHRMGFFYSSDKLFRISFIDKWSTQESHKKAKAWTDILCQIHWLLNYHTLQYTSTKTILGQFVKNAYEHLLQLS